MQVNSLPAEPQGKPKNTGVGSLSLLQGIFPTQESNPGLPHCRKILYQLSHKGSPVGKESTCNEGDTRDVCFYSLVRKIPWRREWLPTPVIWPGAFHGLYSPWGHKESDTTKELHFHFHFQRPGWVLRSYLYAKRQCSSI